jgi:hypothetical protein
MAAREGVLHPDSIADSFGYFGCSGGQKQQADGV